MTSQDIKILWYLRDSNDVHFLKLVAQTANALIELANKHSFLRVTLGTLTLKAG